MNHKFKNKNIFIAKKYNDEYCLREVKEYFEDKNKYLQINTNIAVGKIHFKNKTHSKISTNNSPIKSPINQKQFNTIETKNSKNKKNSFKLSRPLTANVSTKSRHHKLYLNNPEQKNNLNKYYEIKTPSEIIELFKYYKNNIDINNSNKKNISQINNDCIRKKYYIQEKTLINNRENNLQNILLSDFLSNKCKRNKNNLLLNRSNRYLFKKQLINCAYKNKSLSEKFGDFYWFLNLKRSDKTKKEYKTNFINIGKNNHHHGLCSELFFDSGNDDLEVIVRPGNTENDINSEKCKNFQSFEGLKVEGENLLEKEYNNFIEEIKSKKNKARIKLYKDPCEKKVKNIKNLIFKENYLKHKKTERNKNKLKKSSSVSIKQYLKDNKKREKEEDKYIYL